MANVLCVDIGTSSLKAALIDDAGNVLAYSRRMFCRHYTDHAAQEWLPSLCAAVADIRGQSDSAGVDALCVSGNGPTLVAPTGETLLWNESVPACDSPSLFIPRIRAFKEKYAALWPRCAVLFGGPEYLIWQLTGTALSILPEERYRAAYWEQESLLRAGLTAEDCAKLPAFVPPAYCAGSLRAAIGLPEGIAVYCGAPDFVSALVGTDTLAPGKLCDRAGSSEGLNLCVSAPVQAEHVRTLPSPCAPLWNISYLLPESGSRFYAFKQKVERERGGEMDFTALVQACIANDGYDGTLEQGKYLMLQTAMQVRDGLALLCAAAADQGDSLPKKIVVTGGQAANDAWNQMKADVIGLPVEIPLCRDAELLGDAVFAFCGMGQFSSIIRGTQSLYRASHGFSPRAF